MNVAVRFPSDSQLLDSEVFQGPHIVAFSDASHAPLRTTGRRGNFRRSSDISGMYVENVVQASSSGITELYGERAVRATECESGDGIYGKDAWENSVFLQGT